MAEIDKFGRTRAKSSSDAAHAVDNLQIHSQILELRRTLDEKHLNKLSIIVDDGAQNIRIKNILVDGQSQDDDAANIKFMKQYVNSVLTIVERKVNQIESKLNQKLDVNDFKDFVKQQENSSKTDPKTKNELEQ